MHQRSFYSLIRFVLTMSIPSIAAAQTTQEQHQHAQMTMDSAGWQFMHDGIVFGLFNHQGGPRGGDEFRAPNWWMGMLTRKVGASQLTLTGMFSLDPATVGKRGYREIFQVGEAVDGLPLIDRQHPHDLFMQLGVVWRMAVTDRTGFTIGGGPAAEPALGPIAFMHRASAAENPLAPLSHHTFDSTHIAYGVITAAVDHGPWIVEGSIFNGREPDDNRWDFDFGALDSISGRVWFRPTERWEFQASTGHLIDPEELEPGDVQRTTASAAWFKKDDADFTAVTVGYGVNAAHETTRHAVFGEAAKRVGMNTIFGRLEVRQVETAVLVNRRMDPARSDPVGAFTLGAARDVFHERGFEGAFGAAVTLYAVPEPLQITHGDHPVSFQVFFRLRPPAGEMGRMWNMRMSQPMLGQAMDHSMHQ